MLHLILYLPKTLSATPLYIRNVNPSDGNFDPDSLLQEEFEVWDKGEDGAVTKNYWRVIRVENYAAEPPATYASVAIAWGQKISD